jgi:hypothetical protein
MRFSLHADEIKHLAAHTSDSRYGLGVGLTMAGGLSWEAWANPDWRKYVDYREVPNEFWDNDNWVVCLGAISREVIQEHISEMESALRIKMHLLDERHVSPFDITYWKNVESGVVQVWWTDSDNSEESWREQDVCDMNLSINLRWTERGEHS